MLQTYFNPLVAVQTDACKPGPDLAFPPFSPRATPCALLRFDGAPALTRHAWPTKAGVPAYTLLTRDFFAGRYALNTRGV